MPIGDLMMTGLQLMLLGMGMVFGFLILLVVALKAMSRLAARFPDPPPAVPSATAPAAADARLIAVIGAAVARHRAGR